MKSLILALLTATVHAQYNVLHTFYQDDPANGAYPGGSVIADSHGTLYGLTSSGGTNNTGIVYSIRTNGTAFTVLHQFETGGAGADGYDATLLLLGDTLYGPSPFGQFVFAIQTNGANFRVLHDFTDGIGLTYYPVGSLIHSNGTLYGVTRYDYFLGGNPGTVYGLSTNGGLPQYIHHFADTNGCGGPVGGVLLHGSTLYGMTLLGDGATAGAGSGVVYSVDITGSNFQVLHILDGLAGNGASPYGRLITDGVKLYGATDSGGTNILGGITGGIVFALDFTGANFQVLHMFQNYVPEGARPREGLLLAGDTLYGSAYVGGLDTAGTIFQVNTNGTGYQMLHSLSYLTGDGYRAHGDLIRLGNTLYGATSSGGSTGGSNDTGIVFALTLTNSSSPAAITCALSPALATNTVGTTHTVTATVTSNGLARSGTVVNFSVTGANAGNNGTATTGSGGTASFTYTSTAAGTDSIRAITLGATGTATKVWLAAPQPDLTVDLALTFSVCTNDTKSNLCPANGSLTLFNNGNVYGAASVVLTNKCKPGTLPPSCKLGGTLTVTQFAPGSLPSHSLAFHLSTDPVFDAGDVRLAELKLTKLSSALLKGKPVKLNLKLPKGVDFTGYYIIAKIDSGTVVAESDEANNTATSPAIPPIP